MSGNTGVKAVKLDMDAGGRSFVVHATLLWDERDVILVDTGIPGQIERIRDTLAAEGFPLDRLTKVIITHQDLDHIGGLPGLVGATNGRIEVLAHELTKPYIQGEAPLLKRGIVVPPARVDATLQDGDILPYCGGIRVVFTPGHTPDHICLYHEPSRTLISGDALTSHEGTLMPPDPNFTPDMEEARRSVAKLLPLPIETIITYHGGVCTERLQERLAEISKG
ncbi:MBL fold metallo-hydrolase [Paenibacillus chartarius]|uniref:MBL fold metallo-hydrolase n=1 Tax=Paenibacillus chartarius TaxID=747481 RepID=A0ABV6DFX3_9BACL